MAELSIAPHTANILPQATGPGNEPQGTKTTRADTPPATPVSFAATLKAKSEKSTTDSGKDAASENTGTAAAGDTTSAAAIPPASPDAPADSAALLALLTADSTAPVEQADAAATVALVVAAAAIPAVPAIPATRATPATPAVPAAVAPAPTFGTDQLDADGKRSAGAERIVVEHRTAAEPGTVRDRLAAAAAIPAASGESSATTGATDLRQENLHTLASRIADAVPGIATQVTGAVGQAPATHTGLQVANAFGQAGWRDEMGQKLTWMISNNRQQAELILNPPQLGRIEVTLTLDGPQASASFTSPHAAVREALEDSMAHLRQVLADAGVTLGQTHVGSGPRHESGAMNPGNQRSAFGRMEHASQGTVLVDPAGFTLPAFARGRGMVDIFA